MVSDDNLWAQYIVDFYIRWKSERLPCVFAACIKKILLNMKNLLNKFKKKKKFPEKRFYGYVLKKSYTLFREKNIAIGVFYILYVYGVN